MFSREIFPNLSDPLYIESVGQMFRFHTAYIWLGFEAEDKERKSHVRKQNDIDRLAAETSPAKVQWI